MNLNQDTRFDHMDPERLSMLMTFAKELSDAPHDKKIQTFLSIQNHFHLPQHFA